MLIIDAHCHLSARWQPTGPASTLIEDMDAAGVDKTIVFGVFGIRENNEFVLNAFKEYPDRFIPFVYFDPRYEEEALDEARARGNHRSRLC